MASEGDAIVAVFDCRSDCETFAAGNAMGPSRAGP